MAHAPYIKVYSETGEYLASCHYINDAAAIIIHRAGGTIRSGHSTRNILWNEGKELQPASESFDFVLETCNRRI